MPGSSLVSKSFAEKLCILSSRAVFNSILMERLVFFHVKRKTETCPFL